jgi:hypothetical protein
MLVILSQAVLSVHRIDSIISAEFPNPVTHPALHAAVVQFMLHGPCDNRPNLKCRKEKSDGSCSREYPKLLQSQTIILDNCFPQYRRRGLHDGLIGDRVVTDSWVVPHNPYLLARYCCHINIEIAGHIRSCKYVYKYCFKAPDHVHVAVDEVDAYLSGRLLSCAEAVFRILGLRLHQEYPPVQRLDIHLPHQQSIIFNPCDDDDDIAALLPHSTSKLLAWFVLNQQDEAARQWRYVDIPEHYVWDNTARIWKPRCNRRFCLGRMPSVSFSNLELHALRMILHSARGAQNFVDLMTVGSHIHNSFRAAATAAGMLEDNGEAIHIFAEIVSCRISVNSLRIQFCCVLAHCGASNPMELFNMFASDLMYEEVSESSCRSTLEALDVIMRQSYGKSLRDPDFGFAWDAADSDDVLLPVLEIDANVALMERLRPLLSEEQNNAVVEVTASVCFQAGSNVFAVLCSAGTGKTLFANFLACSLRSSGRIVVCVAASALAASLLEGGHTAHHALHIPIPANDGTYCSLSGPERMMLFGADLIIWDEASLIHQDVADTVSRTLIDIMSDIRPFGGKTVVFTGDFKQLLPVVRGGRGDNHTLQQCSWWHAVRQLRFNLNYRAAEDVPFAEMLEMVGSGAMSPVVLPVECMAGSIPELVTRVYGHDLAIAEHSSMILTLTLRDAAVINEYCLDQCSGMIVVGLLRCLNLILRYFRL